MAIISQPKKRPGSLTRKTVLLPFFYFCTPIQPRYKFVKESHPRGLWLSQFDVLATRRVVILHLQDQVTVFLAPRRSRV